MGVMPCSRNECENILCRRIICTGNYICDDCFEMLLVLKKTWQPPLSEFEVRELIEQFMDTPANTDEDYRSYEWGELDRIFDRLTNC